MHQTHSSTPTVTLVVGASGATGRLLVTQLLNKGHHVRAVVRSTSKVLDSLSDHENLTIVRANVLELSDEETRQLVTGCHAIASCLGHNISFKGIYGKPRRLVRDTARKLCKAVKEINPASPVKFVLMNTTGNSNRDVPEKVSLGQSVVIGLLRVVLPPHVDNEQAADFLRVEIGQNDSQIEWVAVRPDGLIDEDDVSEYKLFPSPIRSAIFNPGKTSRINVGNFVARLITEPNVWTEWKGQMPVIYNVAFAQADEG